METSLARLYFFLVIVAVNLGIIVMAIAVASSGEGSASVEGAAIAGSASSTGASGSSAGPAQSSQDSASGASQSKGEPMPSDPSAGSSAEPRTETGPENGESDEAGAPLKNVKLVEGVQVVRLTGNDMMKFNINVFEVRAGQPVRLVFENIGSQPKQAMGHNVVILSRGTQMQQWAIKANQFPRNDYIPTDAEHKQKMIAHTKLLGPGQSDTVEFTAPDERGEYPYVCSFPGHFVQMNGKMIVK